MIIVDLYKIHHFLAGSHKFKKVVFGEPSAGVYRDNSDRRRSITEDPSTSIS